MNMRLAAVMFVAIVAADSAFAEVVWKDIFDDASKWPDVYNYQDNLELRFGVATNGAKSALVVSCVNPGKDPDTAWRVRSARIPLAKTAPKFGFSFYVHSEVGRAFVAGTENSTTAVIWFDAAGREIGRNRMMPGLRKGGYNKVRLVGEIPPKAAAFEVQIGFDGPDIPKGRSVCVTGAVLQLLGADAVCGVEGPDVEAPRVKLLGTWPNEDAHAPLAISITDRSAVAWDGVRVTLDGREATKDFVRTGDTLAYREAKPTWTKGLHSVDVTAADEFGNTNKAHKVFLIGKKPATPVVKLRDDGVTLIGGRPFFPIGIYNVRKTAANLWNYDRAIADLKAAGFNTGHSYVDPSSPELLAAGAKYDFKFWYNATGVGAKFVDEIRHNPQMLAWYIGDDTATAVSPQLLHDRDDNVYAADSTRPSCQADYVESQRAVDRYERFPKGSDILLAEIYPVHGDTNDVNCVAETIRDMKRIAYDNEKYGQGRTHAIWPIIQNFMGWKLWKTYPTPDQVYAMSFASIVYGAKGITWYTYAPAKKPDPLKGRFDAGIADDPVAWAAATNLSRRISALAPVLLERGDTRIAAEILSGPAKDGYGNDSVGALAKRHAGATYVFAVNSTDKPVRARIPVAASGAAEVLWESRTVPVKAGALVDDFKPYAVHIYKCKGE